MQVSFISILKTNIISNFKVFKFRLLCFRKIMFFKNIGQWAYWYNSQKSSTPKSLIK